MSIRYLLAVAALACSSVAHAQPVNDSCDTPIVLPPEGGSFIVDYAGATNDLQVPSCVPNSPPIVWFEYTAAQAGRIDVTTCGGTTYNYFSIWSDCNTELWCNATNSACADGEAALFGLPIAQGQTILIGVATYPFFTGETRLNVTPFLGNPPANDNCAGAIAITNGSTAVSTGNATDSGPAPSCAPPHLQTATGDVWYRYTPTCAGYASVGFAPGTIRYASLEVFDACGGGSLGCSGGFNGETRVTWLGSPSQEYLIRVAGYFFADYQYPGYGTGTLTVGCFPSAPNDTCGNAQAVTLGVTAFDNQYATNDWPTPSCAMQDINDVFFSFTPAADTYVYATAGYGDPTTSGIQESLSVYDSCDPNTIIKCDDIDANDPPSFEWRALAGHTYILRVASQPGRPGTGSLILNSVPFPAPNDECSGALVVTNGVTNFDTRRFIAGAYTSTDPLACYGTPFPGGNESLFNNDLWFSYTADRTDILSVITLDANFVAEIYDGCNGGIVACTEQFILRPTGYSGRGACFQAFEGSTYIIRVGQDFFPGGAMGQLIIEHLGNPMFAVPDDSVSELEPCETLNDTNGSCLTGDPSVPFETAAVCVPTVGSVYYNGDFAVGDVDCYAVPLVEGASYVFEGQSEAPIYITLGAQETCNHEVEELALARLDGQCRIDFSLPFQANLGAAQYFVWVINESSDATCGGQNRYWFRVRPAAGCCPADFNGTGDVNSQDFFDFLVAFFATQPNADFNADGSINSQDFFDFLVAFFAGCP